MHTTMMEAVSYTHLCGNSLPLMGHDISHSPYLFSGFCAQGDFLLIIELWICLIGVEILLTFRRKLP